ncbi:hypothetical protein [Acidovorax sp. 56]|uniref:hypothetical protein n=1 Tax=Acidovorax sp. 56 TaxID=2035205 RepID=UPI001178BFE8|nr:hypothetical protein [Acidovorax sp. 56]
MKRKSEIFLVLIWPVLFTVAGVWPYVSGEPFPLPGLRKLAATDELSRVLQVLAVLLAGIWLTFQGWQTRERLMVFQGVAFALWIQGFLYIGVPFGLAFGCFAGVAISRNREKQA